jgi:hypothetical protein
MGEFILRPGAGVRPSANENDATKAQATRHRRTRRERHMATPHRHTQQANAATAQHRAQSREAPTALDAATEGRIRPGRFGQAPCQAQHAEERVISASRQHRWWKDGRQHDGQGHSEQRLRAGLKRRFRMQHLARGQGRGKPNLLAAILLGCVLRPIIVAQLAQPDALDLLHDTAHDAVIADAACAALIESSADECDGVE